MKEPTRELIDLAAQVIDAETAKAPGFRDKRAEFCKLAREISGDPMPTLIMRKARRIAQQEQK